VFREQPFRLKEIKIEVTNRCNLQCIHCSSEGNSTDTGTMSFEKTMGVLKEAAGMGVREVAFSGGEPLLWPGLDAAVAASTASGMDVLVYTSGNVDGFGDVARRLAENGARGVIFSIFAGNEESHDAVTQVRGSYERTLAALAEANRVGLVTELHFVPMRLNCEQLPGVIQLALDHGARRVSVLRFVPHGRGKAHSTLALTREQNLKLQRMIREAKKRIDLRTGSPYNFLLVNDEGHCRAAKDRLVIAPNLHVYPCDGFKRIRAEQLVGTDQYSRLDRWSLAECWQNSPYLKAVRRYLTTPFAEPCASCSLLGKCASGCLAQKVIAHGELVKVSDPMCLAGGRSVADQPCGPRDAQGG
jgi:radical SAM protein with 4Fe4S-binding SPASM domain